MEGVIFVTYTSLIRKSSHSSRLEQLLKWCGDDYNGCFLFDECHKAKNFTTEWPNSQTKTARAVVDLQMRCPQARVVYCSATGISEPRHMAYLIRLGIWGEGTPYPNFQSFHRAVGEHLGAQELVVTRFFVYDQLTAPRLSV